MMKIKHSTASTAGFVARPFGLRALLENPATDAPAPGAPAVVSSVGTTDEVARILRTELPKAVGGAMEAARAETLEKVAKLEDELKKLNSDFRRVYQHGLENPHEGGGLVERGLIMGPHESVEEWVERQGATTGRITVSGSGGHGRALGRAAGLAGVRDQRGIGAARMMLAFAAAERASGFRGASYDAAASHALKVWGDKQTADMIKDTEELVKRADSGPDEERALARRLLGVAVPMSGERSLNTAIAGQGALFVRPELASFIIEYLWDQLILGKLGMATLPFKNELEILSEETAVSASFRAEATGPNASEPTEGYIKASRKIVTAIAAMTNEYLNEADFGPAVRLRNMIAAALANKFETRAFRGQGAENELRGIDYWIELAGTDSDRTLATGAATFATINKDLLDIVQEVAENKVNVGAPSAGYAMPTAVRYGLMRVRAGTALETRPYYDELRGGTLIGKPVQDTTHLPTNLAGDASGHGTGNKGCVYFGVWDDFVCFQNGGIQMKAHDGAAYKDAAGNTQLGFTNNETVIRGDWYVDTVAMRRGKAHARKDSVDWHIAF